MGGKNMNETKDLAVIGKVTNVFDIYKSKNLQYVIVNSVPCVVPKGKFEVGDLCLFIKTNTWVPNYIAPWISGDKKPRIMNGVVGERLKAKRIMNTYSFGLVISLADFCKSYNADMENNLEKDYMLSESILIEGDDLTSQIDIQKCGPVSSI